MVSKASVLGAIALSLALLLPAFAVAQEIKEDTMEAGAKDPLEMYVSPQSENARDIAGLYDIIWWLAIVVFVTVEGLLFYVVWRFRKNKTVPKGETHRGHTQAEIFWTLVPALIFIFIGVMSVQAMQNLDRIPEEAAQPGNTIDVLAEQFSWTFTYPDGTQDVNQVWLAAGHQYQFNVRSKDVLHAVWMPAFAVKIDAVPGRTNHVWFEPDTPGEYLLQCAEFCKLGHHAMRAKVFIFPEGQNGTTSIFGAPPGAKMSAPDTSKIPADVNVTGELVEVPAGGPGPWGITPRTIEAKVGNGIHIQVSNGGQSTHNWAVPAFNAKSRDLTAGQKDEIAFVADKAGTFEYFCAIPGHKELGMLGTLTVTE